MCASSWRKRPGRMSKRIPSSDTEPASGAAAVAGLRSRRLVVAGLAAMCLLLAATGNPAVAQNRPLDGPRAAGQVGERSDGYAVVRARSASAQVRGLVDSVNARRRAVYQQQAKSRGIAPAAVGRIYAREIVDNAPAGTWFQNASGQWARK